MGKLSIKPGSTDVTVYVSIMDSTSTTGGKKTGLAYDTASLTAYYTRTRGAATAITLATLAAVDSAHSDGGFKEVSSANAPGLYRLDLPDAVCAASARSALVTLKGATGMVQCDLEIDLASEVDVVSWSGTAVATPDTAGHPKVTIKDGTGQGELKITSGTVESNMIEIDGNPTNNYTATLTLKNLDIDAKDTGVNAIRIRSASDGIDCLQVRHSGAHGDTLRVWGSPGGNAIRVTGPADNTSNIHTILLSQATINASSPLISLQPSATSLDAVKIKGNIAVDGIVTADVTGTFTGDLTGKVLGGGAGVITGTGARVVDSSGADVAPAATALDNTVWTNAKAGYIDMAISDIPTVGEIRTELDANPVTVSDVTGNVSGSVASVVGNVGGNVSGSVGSVVGAVGSVTGAVGSVTGAVGSVTAAVTVGTNNDKTGYALVAGYDPSKTAAQAGDAMTLTTAYDPAKTASTQASVDAIAADVVNIETIVELLKQYRIGKHYLEVVGTETFEVVTYGGVEIIRKKVTTIGGTQVTIGANALAISEQSSV